MWNIGVELVEREQVKGKSRNLWWLNFFGIRFNEGLFSPLLFFFFSACLSRGIKNDGCVSRSSMYLFGLARALCLAALLCMC